MTVEEIWLALSKEVRFMRQDGFQIRRLSSPGPFQIFLGIRMPGGMRICVLEAAKNAVPELSLWPALRGIDISRHKSFAGDPDNLSLLLTLKDPDAQGIFSTLIEDLLAQITPDFSQEKAFGAIRLRLERWQHFLEHHTGGLSRAEQVGLYGELCFLRLMLDEAEPFFLLKSWTGPEGEAQDFRAGITAVEVKTSSARAPWKVRVSSEKQLDDEGLEGLFLVFIALDESESIGETLIDVVEQIRSKLSIHELALKVFEGKLLNVGLVDCHRNLYTNQKYRIYQWCCFRVTGDFPRIVGSAVPDGIGDVTYNLGLDACSRFSVQFDEVRNSLSASILL